MNDSQLIQYIQNSTRLINKNFGDNWKPLFYLNNSVSSEGKYYSINMQ